MSVVPAARHIQLTDWYRVVQVGWGLKHSLARGVLHRDVKPENILVFKNQKGGLFFKLADFGLVHEFDPASGVLTQQCQSGHLQPACSSDATAVLTRSLCKRLYMNCMQ
jgi:serine/threonine protein kinase